ncbi:tyrosine-protein phosphatase [Puteibacter caeruleilacunae]|nr:tyrosine-protein phosphatase [Puteibacter caeruleilacunae]
MFSLSPSQSYSLLRRHKILLQQFKQSKHSIMNKDRSKLRGFLPVIILALCAGISIYSLMSARINQTPTILSINKRLVHLDGASNFRDIGGYQTEDDRLIKTGVIYRSDKLSKLTNADIQRLKSLNLTQIIDLRSELEIKIHKDRKPEWISEIKHHQVGNEAVDPDDYTRKVLTGYYTADSYREMMINGYRQMILEGKSYIPAILNELVNEQGASVYHCAGGKDRTGIITAVLLKALGASNETIISDYLLTAHYRKADMEKKYKKLKSLSTHIDDKLIASMWPNKDYINSGLQTIEELGGIQQYLMHYLGVDEMTILRLKNKMLN